MILLNKHLSIINVEVIYCPDPHCLFCRGNQRDSNFKKTSSLHHFIKKSHFVVHVAALYRRRMQMLWPRHIMSVSSSRSVWPWRTEAERSVRRTWNGFRRKRSSTTLGLKLEYCMRTGERVNVKTYCFKVESQLDECMKVLFRNHSLRK